MTSEAMYTGFAAAAFAARPPDADYNPDGTGETVGASDAAADAARSGADPADR